MREIDKELFYAVRQGLSRVKRCIDRGANILMKNYSHSVLHSAVEGNNEEVVKLILSKIKETPISTRWPITYPGKVNFYNFQKSDVKIMKVGVLVVQTSKFL